MMRKKLSAVFVSLLVAASASSAAFATEINQEDALAEFIVPTAESSVMNLQSEEAVEMHNGDAADVTQSETTENADQAGGEATEEGVLQEPAVVTPIAEEPVVEEPVVETPVVEEPVVEEPAVETPVVEEPVVEEPAVETPVVEEPVVEEPAVETPVVEEPVVEEPAVETPVVEEPVVEEPAVETPVVEEPIVEEPIVEEVIEELPVVEELPVAATLTIIYHGQYEDISETIEEKVVGYSIGETVDLNEYIEKMITRDCIVYQGDIKEITLDKSEVTVELNYTYEF
ncbi:hypothetical protein [Anaerovorax sp. IOR16]|uniref:hypothetical protein n=1 Tax=Anaerovorax sp. IOR16 TaxID=2773458 RepID=UPI0019D0E805|nr:hypothetical protein [Anaerovorax sp. IOR16]